MDRETATLLIALVALGLGVVNAYVQWQTYRRSRVAVHVEAAFNFVPNTGGKYVAITATNVGGQPVGVSSMSFETTDGRRVPLLLMQPGCAMGVLQPGEHTGMWAAFDELDQSLRMERTRLRAVVVSGPGGRTWRLDDLGGIASLGE